MNLYFLLLFYIFAEVNAFRVFHNGRRKGGSVREPTKADTHDQKAANVEEEWFTQSLDHFSPTDKRTWQQKYFTNAQYYNASNRGPAFLFIGGEASASIAWMVAGSWTENGAKHGALLFQLEHRYYGQSQPTDDLSTENLKFLTSQQALADLAKFISAMNEKYDLPPDIKWIAFGGSYAGSLAAWFRLKYPHLVHGAISSSGPLLAQVDFRDYYTVIVQSLATHSQACITAIEEGVFQIGVLLKQEIGQSNLNDIFKLCDRIEDSVDNPLDISHLFLTLAENFAGIVQYNTGSTKSQFRATDVTINTACDIMVDETLGAPINRLAEINDILLENNDEECLDYKYDNFIEEVRDISWSGEAALGWRQWIYQTCTEFGFYQTSTNEAEVFGDQFPLDFYIQECNDIFGPFFDNEFLDASINRTNLLFGGLDILVSNVVFIQGSVDPWHPLGITQTVHEAAPAIYIEGTSHCADMYSKASTDSPEMAAAHDLIEQLIDSWLT